MSVFILKFDDVAVQPSNNTNHLIQRAVGFVSLKALLPILDSKSLAPNPRSAKRNSTIAGIIGSLQDTPDLFRYKSKGLLVSSHKVDVLERNRFRISFEKDFVDGVLDGGHNLFAIAVFLLSAVMDEKELNRIKNWEQLDSAWSEFSPLLDDIEIENIQVAVELLFPASKSSEALSEFDQAVFDISQARNANTAVKTESFQNKLGLYDPLKNGLPAEISKRTEWKQGVIEAPQGKPISPRDIVALCWIPLNVASHAGLLPDTGKKPKWLVTPQTIYNNKGDCSARYNALMMEDDVTEPVGGKAGQVRMVKNEAVASCLEIACDLPRLVDLVYENFPRLYNAGGFRFGSRSVVKNYDPSKVKQLKAEKKDTTGYTSVKPVTPYFRRTSSAMKYKYPEGLIIPFITGLSALMEVKGGKVVWITDDIDSLVLEKLAKAAPLFDGQLDAYNWDPQRLAKSPSSHKQAESYYRVL